jgi:hypothetical protein
LVLPGEFFERLALGFGDEEGREDSREHEEGEDLQNMGHELGFTTLVLELEGDDLRKRERKSGKKKIEN